MACDSMVVVSSDAGGERAYYHCKKVYPIEGEFIGCSGESGGSLLWFEWYMDGCDNETLRTQMAEEDFDIVILHSDGKIQCSDGAGIIEDIHEPFYAIGSGTKCALAAMHCGKSATEAVEIAMKIDPHTGGKVQVYDHRI